MTVVCQGRQDPLARQALRGAKVFQDVMDMMARKDQWGSQGCKGLMAFLGYLERRVYLDLQVEKDPRVLQVTEVNLGHLRMKILVPESQGSLGCPAQEGQKEPWDSLDREDPQVKGAKESLDWTARGAGMESLGLLGLLDTKVTLEKPAALEHQAPLVLLGTLAPKGLALVTSVASSSSSTVRQTKNLPVPWACPGSGLGIASCTWKDKRRLTTKTLVWLGLAFPYLARCPLPTATSTKCATTPRETTNPTGWPALPPYP